MSDAKERLIEAGEHLFAREGISGARVKDLNKLAGQRNVSALHYHFGSREGLLSAIIERHSGHVDNARAALLAALPESADLRELMRLVLAPLADELQFASGRDYLRIVPQVLDEQAVSPPALLATLKLAEAQLSHLPERVRSERLLAMLRAATTLLAARAIQRESGTQPHLNDAEFVDNLVDMAAGMLLAPSAIR